MAAQTRLTSVLNTLLLFSSLIVAFAGKLEAQSARDFWKEVIRKCTESDLLGDNMLYMGPSNSVGPGAIWRKRSSGYGLVWEIQDALDESTVQRVVHKGADATCHGTIDKKSNFSLSALLATLISPITGSLAVNLNRAKTIKVEPQTWRWDELKDGPYGEALGKATTAYRTAASAEDDYIAGRALWMGGLIATIEFQRDDSAAVAAAVKDTAKLGDDRASIRMGATWRKDATLVLTSTSPFYIAAELNRYTQRGLAGGQAKLVRTQFALTPTVSPGRERGR